MSKYLIEGSTLTGIADAIRSKSGSTDTIATTDMATQIAAIETGVDTSNATITAMDVMSGKVAYGADGQVVGEAPFGFEGWRKEVQLPTDVTWLAVSYGCGRFVAIAQSVVAYSEDGFTWTQAELPVSMTSATIAYDDINGRFVVCTGTQSGLYSEDGVTWTSFTFPSDGEWRGVTCGNGRFVAVRRNAPIAAYSDDGVTWTGSTFPSSGIWVAVAYGNGLYVTISSTKGYCFYSEDGVTWNRGTISDTYRWESLAFGNGVFVAAGTSSDASAGSGGGDGSVDGGITSSTRIMYSTNGMSWRAAHQTSRSLANVQFTHGRFFAPVFYGGGEVIYSDDGISWDVMSLHTQGLSLQFAYGNGIYLALACNPGLYSVDGTQWLQYADPQYNVTDHLDTGITLSTEGAESKVLRLVDGELILGEPLDWVGDFTISGQHATTTYFTEAGCSLAVDPIRGMAFVTMQSGTNTSYENILFTLVSAPDGVTFLDGPSTHATGGTKQRYFTAALTGVTGKVNVAVELNGLVSGGDYVTAKLTVTYAE